MPGEFINQWQAVSVENHLNMVKPTTREPLVALHILARLFNCAIVDDAFRCISGSVAVSAAELAALPLPPPETVRALVHFSQTPEQFESAVRNLYLGRRHDGSG
jgi:adenine-specific DNA-methyltransferase